MHVGAYGLSFNFASILEDSQLTLVSHVALSVEFGPRHLAIWPYTMHKAQPGPPRSCSPLLDGETASQPWGETECLRVKQSAWGWIGKNHGQLGLGPLHDSFME
jgi:hypothetical protein